MIKPRSLLTFILLSIVTCGIYAFIWYYSIQEDLNTICQDGKDMSPIAVLALSLITGGIFIIIWQYLQGERMRTVGMAKGVNITDSGSTYLLWSILGSCIIVGPLIAMSKFINNFNTIAAIYNSNIVNPGVQSY